MGVFFRFGDTQLRFVVLRHPFAKRVRQRGGRIGNGRFDVGCVFGQHHEVQVNHFLAREAVKVSVNKGTGDFTRTVSTEVHENERVAVFHRGIGLTFGADHGGFYEFIVFIAGIGGLQTFNGGIGLEFTLRQRHQVIRFFHAIPTVVAVHRVVTANDGGDATFAQRSKFLFEFFQG